MMLLYFDYDGREPQRVFIETSVVIRELGIMFARYAHLRRHNRTFELHGDLHPTARQ